MITRGNNPQDARRAQQKTLQQILQKRIQAAMRSRMMSRMARTGAARGSARSAGAAGLRGAFTNRAGLPGGGMGGGPRGLERATRVGGGFVSDAPQYVNTVDLPAPLPSEYEQQQGGMDGGPMGNPYQEQYYQQYGDVLDPAIATGIQNQGGGQAGGDPFGGMTPLGGGMWLTPDGQIMGNPGNSFYEGHGGPGPRTAV